MCSFLIHFQDTLVESGYTNDVAEELIGRVISVVESSDHFISQANTVLEDVRHFILLTYCTNKIAENFC